MRTSQVWKPSLFLSVGLSIYLAMLYSENFQFLFTLVKTKQNFSQEKLHFLREPVVSWKNYFLCTLDKQKYTTRKTFRGNYKIMSNFQKRCKLDGSNKKLKHFKKEGAISQFQTKFNKLEKVRVYGSSTWSFVEFFEPGHGQSASLKTTESG